MVVGSANLDLVVTVDRHPAPGETLLGSDYERHPGGKGANQAVAAALSGAQVRFVGCVGRDEFAELLLASLTAAGVDTEAVERVERPTGVAFIQVDAEGENSIVVAPGANAELTPERAHRALAVDGSRPGARFDVLCLQLEIPLPSVLAAARAAREAGADVLLNLAPAMKLGAAELSDVTHLLVNAHEAAHGWYGDGVRIERDHAVSLPSVYAESRRIQQAIQNVVLNEEFARAGVPRVTRGMGEWLVGPSIIVHGTDEQKARYLPPMLRGEEMWCQLFSEPEAGSDLAGLTTRAVRDGDVFIVNGQKIWTSLATVARYGILIARTDPDTSKYTGISYFIVPMDLPGIDIRPLRNMVGGVGEAGFCEVFFTDVAIPAENLIGEEGRGFRYILDGARVGTGFEIDDLEVEWIEALEIYQGISTMPAEFSALMHDERGSCGLIVIWTRNDI